MKKIKNIIAFCLLFFFFMSFNTNGQVPDCSMNYEKALLLYNTGMSDSALKVLKPCLENRRALNKVSKGTCGRIFRLAALSSIMSDNPVDAEKYIRRMIIYRPDYKQNQNNDDLMEFRLILDKISAQPSLRVGIMTGINFSFVALKKHYSNYVTGGGYSLSNRLGYQAGIICEKILARNLSLEAGAEMSQYNFKYTVNATLGERNQYNQNITMVEIPVISRYYLTRGSFRPYLAGGISGRFLLNSSEKSDVYGRYWFTNSSNSNKILATFLTDCEYFNLVLGGGAAYDLKKFSIRLDLRYDYSFNSSSRSSKFNAVAGYEDIPPLEKFHNTDDINLISFKNIQISIGFSYNLKYKVF